jgi:DNA-binding transcriptional LysR family regulator
MDLRQLEMLTAVVDSGGYKKAGEILHVSHSAVHRQIRLLEYEINDRLFVRKGKSIQITETGHKVVATARRIQQEIAGLHQQISGAKQLATGHLHIGTGTSILTLFLPPIVQRFKKQYPGIEVCITTGPAHQMINDVQSGKLDLGIVYAPADLPPGEAVPSYELLYQEEFVLVVGKRHPLAKKASVTLTEAVKFPFILYPRLSNIRRLFDRALQRLDLSPQVVMEVENEEAMEKLIAIDIGICLISKRRAINDKIRQVRIRDLRFHCDVGVVFSSREYLSPPVAEFTRMCREAVKLAD